jgi:hypothetical protein
VVQAVGVFFATIYTNGDSPLSRIDGAIIAFSVTKKPIFFGKKQTTPVGDTANGG